MGVRTPETCWAVHKRQTWEIVASSWLIYLNCVMMHGLANFRFVTFVRLSICPHGTTRISLDGFSWKFIFMYFSKNTVEKIQVSLHLTSITGTVHQEQPAFLIISCSAFLRMRNVSDKSFTGNQNTHFVFSNVFFSKSCRLWRNVDKYCTAGHRPQMTLWCMRTACRIPKAIDTHAQYAICIAFPLPQKLHEPV